MLPVALAVSLSLGASTGDYNAVRQHGNNAGLSVLGAWGLSSAIAGAVGLAVADGPERKGMHAANLAWGVVNVGFAVVGLFLGSRPGATRPDRAGALADGVSTQELYAVNAAFDVGYLALAALSWLHFEDGRLKGFAKGSMLQALALFAFDATMGLFHQLNNERVRQSERP